MAGSMSSTTDFFFMTLILIIWVLVIPPVHCQDTSPSAEEYEEMKKYFATINKPAVRNFTNQYGDIFDCVDINKQPAFDNPLLKDHKIQLQPSSLLLRMQNKSSYIAMKIGVPEESCPPGTVPIRRIRMEELLRAGSLANYRSKYGRAGGNPLSNDGVTHEHCVRKLDWGGPYHGTEGGLNLWNPTVDTNYNQVFSLAQFWFVNDQGELINTIEGGWHVYPQLYGNDATHLFIYWTATGYQTGYYNLDNGFVQVHRSIMPGLVFPRVSYPDDGIQPGVVLKLIKDSDDGHWWLGFREAFTSSEFIWVGYWPASLFNTLNSGANVVSWGGEVCSRNDPGIFPPMGSGQWAQYDYGKAAFANKIRVAASDRVLVDAPDELVTVETRPNCYTVVDKGNDVGNFGRYWFFGGPGGYCSNI